MNKITKTAAFIIALCTVLTAFTGCTQKVGSFSIDGRTVMTVNGYEVSCDEYKYFYYNHMKDLEAEIDGIDFTKEENIKLIKDRTEKSLKRMYAVIALFDEYELEFEDNDEDDINDSVAGYIYEQGGTEKFYKWLADARMSGDVFRKILEYSFFYDVYLRELLMTGIDGHIKMDDETLINDIMDNFYHYTQIFVEFREGDNYVENGEEIEKAYNALRNGADFYKVAEEYSDWNVHVETGVYSTKGEKLLIIEKTALSLEVGEYSEVVKSTEGHHIIMRLPMDRDYVVKHLNQLEEASYTRRYHEVIDAYAEKAEVKYNKYYDTLTHDTLISYQLYTG